jgi:enhancing lycopene biosynthesis protein 2
MKRIAVVLAGCGHKDGTEITEAVSTLVALSETGVSYKVFAPDMSFPVTNHAANDMVARAEDARNVLIESARISRGDIQSLRELSSKQFDGLVFPGGFGAALHLCSWAKTGANCEVHPEVERIVKEFYIEQKPIAAICIAPALLARVLGKEKITITIGRNDKITTAEIEKTGALHEDCDVTDYVTDRDHKIVTTPAYMFGDAKPFEVFTGIRKAIREFVEMA